MSSLSLCAFLVVKRYSKLNRYFYRHVRVACVIAFGNLNEDHESTESSPLSHQASTGIGIPN